MNKFKYLELAAICMSAAAAAAAGTHKMTKAERSAALRLHDSYKAAAEKWHTKFLQG